MKKEKWENDNYPYQFVLTVKIVTTITENTS